MHASGLPPEILHQGPFLVGEVIAVPGEGALKVLPRLPQKGQVRRGLPCQIPQYLLAQRFTSGISVRAL